jgi:hypothetical protein
MSVLTVLVPTRQRPRAVHQLARAFADTCTADTQLIWCLDGRDQVFDYRAAFDTALLIYPRQYFLDGPRRRLVGTLNFHAPRLAAEPGCFAIAYLGDDHRPRTKGWDTTYLDALRELRTGIVYGDDLHQGENLPTQVAITSDIIRAVGYMAPPVLSHMYCDNYWRDLGTGAGCLRYLPHVIIEHCHPAFGKTRWDASYRDSNSADSYAADQAAYATFAQTDLAADIATVRGLRNTS